MPPTPIPPFHHSRHPAIPPYTPPVPVVGNSRHQFLLWSLLHFHITCDILECLVLRTPLPVPFQRQARRVSSDIPSPPSWVRERQFDRLTAAVRAALAQEAVYWQLWLSGPFPAFQRGASKCHPLAQSRPWKGWTSWKGWSTWRAGETSWYGYMGGRASSFRREACCE